MLYWLKSIWTRPFLTTFFFWLVVLFIIPFWFCKCSKWSKVKPKNPNSWNEVVKGPLIILGPSQHYKALEYPATHCHSCTFLSKVQGRWLHALCHTHNAFGRCCRGSCSSVPLIPGHQNRKAYMLLCHWFLKSAGAELRHLPRLWPWVYKDF